MCISRFQGLPEFFQYPLIISGTGRATNFTFCMHIISIDQNKSPLQISGKVAVGVVRTLAVFQGTHILVALCGHLCDSLAFLLLRCVVLWLQTTRIVSLGNHLSLELLGFDLTQFELGQ